MVWTPGQSLQSGKYIIDRVLGVGGFGITYLAIQNSRRQNQKPVVIKTLKDEVRQDPRFVNYQTKLQQDFLNEALKLAKCLHPHIVEVQEIIREDNLDCIVMEFVQGESLADRLSRQGVLSELEALRYIQQIGEALTLVHSRGLLHRDIKPQNIMIRSGTSEAVLIDFGLAREFMQDLIQTHSLALTHGFAPLEQYDRRAKRGAYSDVYALSATLYCSLTQRTPHAAYMRLSGTVLESPRQLNSGISDRVNKAILKGLELRADDRPQSVQEWLGLLEEPIVQPPTTQVWSGTFEEPIAHPVTSERDLSVQPSAPSPQTSWGGQQQISTRPVTLTVNAYTQSPNVTPQTPSRPTQKPATTIRRRSNTIPWRYFALSVTGYAVLGASLTASSVWVWSIAWAWAFAWSMAWAGTSIGIMAGVMAGALAAGAGAATIAVAKPSVEVVAGVMAGGLVGIAAMGTAGQKLLITFNRSHTFLILVGTSLAGLGLGWLIRTILRSSYPQTFGML